MRYHDMTPEQRLSCLGKQVKVRLGYETKSTAPDPVFPGEVIDSQDYSRPVIAEGQLLGFGDEGTFEILGDDGFVHYCWPLLDIEERNDGP